MANGDPEPVQINLQKLRESAFESQNNTKPVSTRTNAVTPSDFVQREERSFAERNVEEGGDFDTPAGEDQLTEEEASILEDVRSNFGFAPRVFERSGFGTTTGGLEVTTGRVETEGVEGARPDEPTGLSNEPQETQVILHEDRGDNPDIVREELIHALQQSLGGNQVEEIIDEVGGPDNQGLKRFAEISVDEDHSQQPQEVLADSLMAEMTELTDTGEEDDEKVVLGGTGTPQEGQLEILRSMLNQAGNPAVRSLFNSENE